MRIRGASFDHTNPSTEVHRRPETSTDFVRRWRTIGARFGPSSSQAVPISWFPYGVPGAGRRGPCLRVGRGGLEAARPRRGGYALARVFVSTLAAPADGVRMLVCPSPTPPDADARGIFLEHLPSLLPGSAAPPVGCLGSDLQIHIFRERAPNFATPHHPTSLAGRNPFARSVHGCCCAQPSGRASDP